MEEMVGKNLDNLIRRRDERLSWLMNEALPLWAERGYDRKRGLFFEGLDDDMSAVEAPRRSRVQSRQIYVFATAGALGWTGPWRERVDRGLADYLDRYLRPDGLFRTLVGADAHTALDETVTIYDQAFSLFALAAAEACGSGSDNAGYARRLLQALETTRQDEQGLFREAGDQPYQANCHMHLLEAALAWEALDPEGPWSALADHLAKRCLRIFIDPESGALLEFFDNRWRPAKGRDGGVIEPGHNFEWAWLMQRWGASRADQTALAAARRLHAVGRLGVDRRGVTIDELDGGLGIAKAGARIWPQTEHLKSSLILAQAHPAEDEYLRHISDAFDALDLYIDPAPRGLWKERLQPDGALSAEYTRATSLYHLTCALAEGAARLPTP